MNIGELRFLVVEDHGFQRWIVGNMLEKLGAHYVFSAGDGAAALELLAGREPPIDVVVTDLDMPGMDGMEFIRHIGEAGYPVSVILASGLEPALVRTVENMAQAYGVNLIGTIHKPITAQKLDAVVRLHEKKPEVKERKEPSFTVEELAGGLKRGEFEPFFQPKVELKTRVVKGAEALARWRHPVLGIIRPQAFVAAMEEAGLIDDLTRVIIAGAALNCALWREAGLDARVSINVSPASLRDVAFGDRVMALIGAQGLESRDVIFEVTESAAEMGLGASLENISRLRMRGFGLSIDDYGTGYSSMERLAQVPFTELKIDQSFVKNASTQASSRAALESSLEMAQKLGIVAVAEGVENRHEWDLVRALGCQLAQGYLIAQPMDAGEFMSWVRMPQQIRA
jgi:EAL domain-containing protein (putative c-di-GMP-specific phosphodiesterase class I)/AmiR/NasT family two-component response regulator